MAAKNTMQQEWFNHKDTNFKMNHNTVALKQAF